MATIMAAQPSDLTQVKRIANLVFSELGNYTGLLPRFFGTSGVSTYLASHENKVIGFIMLGFLPWSKGNDESNPWICEILAIAVVPEFHRQGIGTELFDQALLLTLQMSEWRNLREIQLTCPEENEIGLKFFYRHGFKVGDKNHGAYSNGQLAWRLNKKISDTP